MRKKFLIWVWSLFIAALLIISLAFVAIDKGWIGYMPPIDELQRPISRYASQILSADGKLLGTWSRNENRVFVDYDSIAPLMFDALTATEDVRFYDHSGIDAKALARAVVKRGILGNTSAGGGSTITQQLAKQLYSGTASSTMERVLQKPIEWVIAVKLERNYTKEEILTMYLNYFDFLHNAVGIKTAANTYFNKEPEKLDVLESATLIGMCKNPSYFNPIRNPERCRERRNVVLGQMHKAGYISEADMNAYSDKPLTLNFRRADHKDGSATYFRDYLRRIMMAKKPSEADYPSWNRQKYYEDSLAWATDPLYGWCNKNTKKNGDYYDVYSDGLKVYTTIDSRMQQYAEDAVYEHVAKYLQPRFFAEKKGRSKAPFSDALTSEQVRGSKICAFSSLK